MARFIAFCKFSILKNYALKIYENEDVCYEAIAEKDLFSKVFAGYKV
ncbi:MAG: hypothetical protein LBD56_02180 [Endomicrobium sp.]|jgi:hypothetical protein|nr:hypothetical protein [Endomicrobium sp.]